MAAKKEQQVLDLPSTKKPVMVTTAHRGVFFGYSDQNEGETITLEKARMCVYWSRDMKGVMGLASTGPSPECKIGPQVEAVTLRNITAVINVTPEAAKKWEAAPWR